jgi:hypothetical protein
VNTVASLLTRQMDVEGDEDTPHIDTESASYALQGRDKYTGTYLTVQDEGFWVEAEEYVNMNRNVCAAIGILSSDSALLSDTDITERAVKDEINALTIGSYPLLLGYDADLAAFKAKRLARMKEHLRGQHYLALLVDPRQHVREWVALQPGLVGSYATEVRFLCHLFCCFAWLCVT